MTEYESKQITQKPPEQIPQYFIACANDLIYFAARSNSEIDRTLGSMQRQDLEDLAVVIANVLQGWFTLQQH